MTNGVGLAIVTQPGQAPPGTPAPVPQQGGGAYIATHYTGQLPAAQGDVAKNLDAANDAAAQRALASTLHQFLDEGTSDLRDLNGDVSHFTALVSVPDTNTVKVIYGLGIGTAAIGQVSPLANKILALFGEGGVALGPAQTIVLDATVRNKKLVRNLTDAAIQTAFTAGKAVNAAVERAGQVNDKEEIMCIAPIPAYLVWDGFEQDLDASMVYERLLDCQHDSPMRTHALAFLRSCMIGGWRVQDEKPFVPVAMFFAMVPAQARLWAAQRFKDIFPALNHAAAMVTPPRPAAGAALQQQPGAAVGQLHPPAGGGMFQLDAAAIQLLFQQATAAAITPPAAAAGPKDDGTFKVSEGEKARMRAMCGLPENAGDECFPKWYRDIHDKHLDDIGKAHIVASAVERSWIIEDAEVPMYPGLIKTILKRDWIATDHNEGAALVNAAKGFSPFAMIDLSDEDVAEMMQDDADLLSATNISTSDIKASRSKLKPKTPPDAASFLLMLSRFTNLLHALFSSQSPLYKQMYNIVRTLRKYSPNARSKLSHEAKTSILWIILLQARRFANGKMIGNESCLGEFTEMVRAINAKNCENISHVEVPTDLLEPSRKRKVDVLDTRGGGHTMEKDENTGKKRNNGDRIVHPYSTDLEEFFKQPLKDAGNPGLSKICDYCGITRQQLLPELTSKDCQQYLVMGHCMFGKTCKFDHRTATKKQIFEIKDKLKRFKDDPLGLTGEKMKKGAGK